MMEFPTFDNHWRYIFQGGIRNSIIISACEVDQRAWLILFEEK